MAKLALFLKKIKIKKGAKLALFFIYYNLNKVVGFEYTISKRGSGEV